MSSIASKEDEYVHLNTPRLIDFKDDFYKQHEVSLKPTSIDFKKKYSHNNNKLSESKRPSRKYKHFYTFSDIATLSASSSISATDVGGKGLRLKPITNFLPKSLLPINGEPIISKIINKFSEIGVRDFHISINIKDTITKNYINTSLKQGLKINIYQEKDALGTIGALGFFKKIKKSIKAIIVSNCDTLISYDLNKVLKNHFDKKADMTIIAVKDNYSIPYGVIQTDRNNFLTDVIEKPNYDYIFSSGVYILNLNLLRIIKKNQKMDFNEFVNKALKNKFKINVYNITRDKWTDIGNFTELNKVIN